MQPKACATPSHRQTDRQKADQSSCLLQRKTGDQTSIINDSVCQGDSERLQPRKRAVTKRMTRVMARDLRVPLLPPSRRSWQHGVGADSHEPSRHEPARHVLTAAVICRPVWRDLLVRIHTVSLFLSPSLPLSRSPSFLFVEHTHTHTLTHTPERGAGRSVSGHFLRAAESAAFSAPAQPPTSSAAS